MTFPKNASKCVIYGCQSRGIVVHRFPNPRRDLVRLVKWIDLVGLNEMDPIDVYTKKFICNNHFEKQCFSPGTKRLNANSYPTLCLPGSTNSKPSQPGVKSSISIHQSDPEISGYGMDENIVHSTPAKTHAILNDKTLSVGYTNLDDTVMSGFNVLETSVRDEVLTGVSDCIGINRSLHLTPKCKQFYAITNNLLRKCHRLNNSKQNFKTRLCHAEKFSDSYVNEKFSDKLTAAASLFTSLQMRETKKKSKGHQFTTDEKILSLTLYKKSPKCYNLLSKLFNLPCKRTLDNILRVSINPGISPIVMAVLKENVKKLKPKERYCSILFDEVSLSSGLSYNVSSDQIDGFVNTGSYKNQELADHALVFMIRGITKKFKQPIAYSFCQGATKQGELVKQLKCVIRDVQNTGLCVVATICDQGKANEGAMRILNSETRSYCIRNNIEYRDDFYEVDLENGSRIKIVHLFDVPHLMKCVRNNLLTKDLVYELDGVKRCAKWKHLEQLYAEDNQIPDTKMLPRLTDNHVLRHQISKMKVECATQVFSHRVSAVMNFLASKNIIESNAIDTAKLFLFFDQLFDSLNGSCHKVIEGKIYRTSIKRNSVHHELWSKSLKVLNTMHFVTVNEKNSHVPTLKNWIITIKGFQTLTRFLETKGITSILPRQLNQDPLENFFGAVRSLGCTNPTCGSFISAYKTLFLNNLLSSQSPRANCEDFVEGSLMSYKNLFSFVRECPKPIKLAVDLPSSKIRTLNEKTENLTNLTHSYIAGYLAKKLNKDIFKGCKECLYKVCSSQLSNDIGLIVAREYLQSRSSLKYPSLQFRSLIHNIIIYINERLSIECHRPRINKLLVDGIIYKFDITAIHCSNHNQIFQQRIVGVIVKLFINHWCVEVNRILSGKQQIQPDEKDHIKIFANELYSKHKKKTISRGKFNQV